MTQQVNAIYPQMAIHCKRKRASHQNYLGYQPTCRPVSHPTSFFPPISAVDANYNRRITLALWKFPTLEKGAVSKHPGLEADHGIALSSSENQSSVLQIMCQHLSQEAAWYRKATQYAAEANCTAQNVRARLWRFVLSKPIWNSLIVFEPDGKSEFFSSYQFDALKWGIGGRGVKTLNWQLFLRLIKTHERTRSFEIRQMDSIDCSTD